MHDLQRKAFGCVIESWGFEYSIGSSGWFAFLQFQQRQPSNRMQDSQMLWALLQDRTAHQERMSDAVSDFTVEGQLPELTSSNIEEFCRNWRCIDGSWPSIQCGIWKIIFRFIIRWSKVFAYIVKKSVEFFIQLTNRQTFINTHL